MSERLQTIYLARHGETAWSVSGQHTGLTDLPPTERGERNAQRLQKRLLGFNATKVFTSPLRRATRTCELAGFGTVAEWLGLEAGAPGRYFLLSTASLSALGYEHNLSQPVIRLWNDDRHVGE